MRMEILVLTVLDWRLRSITPFSFIDSFACKIDPSGTCVGYLISRSADIILSDIQGTLYSLYTFLSYIYLIKVGKNINRTRHFHDTEARLLEYRPSCIAVAAVFCAASEIPSLSLIHPEIAEAWCDGLSKVITIRLSV